jgi:TusE/DsrC/DsvC family sulfur relay protein
MPSQMFAGRALDVTNDGYLIEPKDWNPDIGEAIAKELGVPLTPAAWKVIQFARTDFFAEGQTPGLRRITAQTAVPMKELYSLFPGGPGKLIAKIGGVPKPKSCL